MRYYPAFSAILAASLLSAGAVRAEPSKKWSATSDVLAIGLPAAAAAFSYSQSDTRGLEQLAFSQALTVASSGILKGLIDAPRPNGQDNRGFPSRHTAVAFSAAGYMDLRYGKELGFWRPLAYGAASLVGLGRVQGHEHHWVDVLGGAALGYTLSTYWTEPSQAGRLVVFPAQSGVGLAWHRTF